MTVQRMREYISNAYKGSKSWAARMSKMPDAQVIAVYSRLKKKEV